MRLRLVDRLKRFAQNESLHVASPVPVWPMSSHGQEVTCRHDDSYQPKDPLTAPNGSPGAPLKTNAGMHRTFATVDRGWLRNKQTLPLPQAVKLCRVAPRQRHFVVSL
jgi:hypothetical protein